MKKIISTLMSFLIFGSMFSQVSLQMADQAYAKGEYKEAASMYEELAKTEGVSSDLYYNLGNTFFKQGEFPLAILNYERALRLNPNNDDAVFNLNIARAQTLDKIEPVEKFFINEWAGDFVNFLSSDTWARLAIVSFLLLLLCLGMYFFIGKSIVRKIGFFAGMALLVITVVTNIAASSQKTKMMTRNTAIVMTPTVTVKSSPADSGTELFVIHEGLKVTVRSTLGEWSEIELADGNIGWLKSLDVEKI